MEQVQPESNERVSSLWATELLTMTDEQLAYSLSKLKEMGIVTSGDAQRQGIGVITDARAKASWDFLVSAKLVDPAKLDFSKTYSTEFVRDLKVMP